MNKTEGVISGGGGGGWLRGGEGTPLYRYMAPKAYGILKSADLKMGLSLKTSLGFHNEKLTLRTGNGKLHSVALEKDQDLENWALYSPTRSSAQSEARKRPSQHKNMGLHESKSCLVYAFVSN